MATYLQGVQDYIPQIQPAQPDFNFYNTVLQTKQNQYDTNYKKLNKLYGQLYYADLSRESNVEKREQLVKDIDFNLKRVAGMDLSLEQNMTQATQLFKPFYEDKVLVKDMAWTKNYMNQRSRAEGMKNATNKELREQYWNTGVRAMDYMKEEFAGTSDEESMGFRNASYTPYTNVMKIAGEIAKEFGDIEAAPEVGGQWIIKRRNGKVLEMPLRKLFEARLGNDPSIQAIYQTQAYVDRKDYAYGNAAQFEGDKDAAEMDYLQKNYKMLVGMNTQEKAKLEEAQRMDNAKSKEVEERIKNGNARPNAESYLENVLESLNVNTSLYKKEEALSEDLGTGSATLTTSSGFKNPYGDIDSLRRKVDAGMASALMKKDFGEAAYTYSLRNAKVDIVANPYGVLKAKHKNDLKAIKAKKEADLEVQRTKHGLETGALIMDARTGEIKINPETEYVKEELVLDATTGEINKYQAAKDEMEGRFEGGTEEVDRTVTQYKVVDPATNKEKWVSQALLGTGNFIALRDAQGRPVTQEKIVTETVYTGAKPYLTEVIRMGQQLIQEDKIDEATFLGWFGLGDKYSKFKSSAGMTAYPENQVEDGRTVSEKFKFPLASPLRKVIDNRLKSELVDGKIFDEFKTGSLDSIEDLINNINAAGGNDPNFFKGVYDRVRNYTEANVDLFAVENAIPKLEKTGVAASDFGQTYNNWQDWKKQFNTEIKRELLRKEDVDRKAVDMLFTADGDIISQEAFEKLKFDISPKKPSREEAKITEPKNWWERGKANLQQFDLSAMSAGAGYSGKINPQTGKEFRGYNQAAVSNLENTWEALNNIVTSNKLYTRVPEIPGLPAIFNPGSGLTSTAGSITVAPKAYGTKGQVAFSRFADQLMSQGVDHVNSVVSIGGASKNAFEEAVDEDGILSRKGLMVLNDYISKTKDPNSKVESIRMVGQKIAAGDATKGAFKFFFPREYLEGFKQGKDETGGLSLEEIDQISEQGITYIGDNSSSIFKTNPLIKNHTDPIKAIVDYNNSYKYKDPRGNGSFNVTKDNSSISGYKVDFTVKEWNPDSNKYEEQTISIPDQQFDNNLYLLREQAMNRLDLLDQHNIAVKNGRI